MNPWINDCKVIYTLVNCNDLYVCADLICDLMRFIPNRTTLDFACKRFYLKTNCMGSSCFSNEWKSTFIAHGQYLEALGAVGHNMKNKFRQRSPERKGRLWRYPINETAPSATAV